jgi:hypothetical protein
MGNDPSRLQILADLEGCAEQLTERHDALIAQIESQLRAVHHTLHRIGTLRSARHRVGPELSDSARHTAVAGLTDEIIAIEAHLEEQEDTCRAMHAMIRKMYEGVSDLRLLAARLKSGQADGSVKPSQER